MSGKPRISKQSVESRNKNMVKSMKQNAIYSLNKIDNESHKDNFKV